MAARTVVIPYTPRPQFRAFHDRRERWAVLVCHRRAGKTFAAVNDLLRAAVTCKSAHPLFAYIGPFRSQAKDVAWSALKYFSEPVSKVVNEAELMVTLINGAKIRVFGADNADAMRGLGFDGVFMDEVGDFKPSVWGAVVRPALSDKQGWAVFAGTPKGKNHFWQIWEDATGRLKQEWFAMMLKASDSKILPQSELDDVKRQITQDQYLQEYECNFEAAIMGAFYGTEMRLLEEQGHITDVPYDPEQACYTSWDLGHTDDTSIWWFQMRRGELRIIDFYTISGSGVEDVANVVAKRKIPTADGREVTPHYEKHFLPHDAKAKTFAANGKSTIEQLVPILGFGNLSIVPMLSKQDGIQAVRMTLPHCWFDKKRTASGIYSGVEALKQYEREYDEDTKAFRAAPKHNWASNPADAFRYLALSWREETPIRKLNPEVALVVGPGNTATLEDLYASQRPKRRQRI